MNRFVTFTMLLRALEKLPTGNLALAVRIGVRELERRAFNERRMLKRRRSRFTVAKIGGRYVRVRKIGKVR